MITDTKDENNVAVAAEIFEKYGDKIRTEIWLHVNDKSSIDDICHDFFISLVEKPIPRKDQNIRAFIHKAIKNDVLDAASRSKSYYARNCKYAQIHTKHFDSDTPESIMSYAEDVHQIFKIVESQLLEHEAQAIIHKYRYDRDTDETAHMMGVSRRSVSHYLCTGLRKLRNLIHSEQFQQDFSFIEG